jgi:hypothetical protein
VLSTAAPAGYRTGIPVSSDQNGPGETGSVFVKAALCRRSYFVRAERRCGGVAEDVLVAELGWAVGQSLIEGNSIAPPSRLVA